MVFQGGIYEIRKRTISTKLKRVQSPLLHCDILFAMDFLLSLNWNLVQIASFGMCYVVCSTTVKIRRRRWQRRRYAMRHTISAMYNIPKRYICLTLFRFVCRVNFPSFSCQHRKPSDADGILGNLYFVRFFFLSHCLY